MARPLTRARLPFQGLREASSWAPFRHRDYRRLWAALVTSQVGTWMQTVGAQWLMLTLDGSAFMVALVQVAISGPVVLLALPAGALGDIVDRRKLLMAATLFNVATAFLLAVLTLTDHIAPWSLLALTATMGAGDALRRPTWQAIQSDLVPREEIAQAAALNSAGVNVGRAVGPALGGALVATAGAGWVFLVNAVSFTAVLGALLVWRRAPEEAAMGPERMGAALRAGARYARSSPRLRASLVRTALFITFASAIWALLPVLARDTLDLGSGGYGLLLGGVGVGAVCGAAVLPSLTRRLSVDRVVVLASAVFAVGALLLAWVPSVPVAVVAVFAVGISWIVAIASLNGSVQTILPGWVRARGLALFLLVIHGGQAVGAAVWGALAGATDVQMAFTAVSGGLLLGLLLVLRYPVRSGEDLDLRPSGHWAEPELALDADPAAGPVLVTVEYHVPAGNHEDFRTAMLAVGRSRRRSGASRWSLFQDAEEPDRFLETFTVVSWDEHLRQHERITVADRRFEERAQALLVDGTEPRVSHLLSA